MWRGSWGQARSSMHTNWSVVTPSSGISSVSTYGEDDRDTASDGLLAFEVGVGTQPHVLLADVLP